MASLRLRVLPLLICAVGSLLSVVAGDANGDLFASIETQDVSGMESALASGADINSKGPGGQTPLMNSVLTGCLSCVKYLLRQDNVDATIPEKDGEWNLHTLWFITATLKRPL